MDTARGSRRPRRAWNTRSTGRARTGARNTRSAGCARTGSGGARRTGARGARGARSTGTRDTRGTGSTRAGSGWRAGLRGQPDPHTHTAADALGLTAPLDRRETDWPTVANSALIS